MTVMFAISTSRHDFEARPRFFRSPYQVVAAWLWFEVRWSR